jgi:hypothetical protein
VIEQAGLQRSDSFQALPPHPDRACQVRWRADGRFATGSVSPAAE